MTGYAPLFDSLTTGTLCGKWPDIGLWPIVLAMADKHGVLDVTPAYISGVTGLPVEEVSACMARFCDPDPFSRTAAEDGRRLVLLEPERRNWGWRVVNHGLYRERARLMAKSQREVESGKNAARLEDRRRPPETAGFTCDPPATAADPLSESDANADILGRGRAKRASRLPDDFEPDLKYASDAVPDIDARAEYERFRDFWRSKPGSAGTKLDWQATWRNWVRTCRDSGRYAKGKPAGRRAPLDAFDAARKGNGN